ncbi:RNA polymerase sigma factor [Luteolibacter pohnpeiensis]|uniref:RNA polymerase sigma factor n=1 Tax=Luteolibacter pohnpeiensis TaxID=454153 RepID=A0A934SA13_9BACT|nr:RNA polymerase sigma factor [Luteolibacter pohnpeiensis]MBK1883621.1 RNA polymerase sigma factor [Luteolibacter pohnpeiensis]
MSAHPTETEWKSWLADHTARFLLFARQQTRCSHDAEDVLQDALVESWKRAGGQPEPALVFATIRRRAIDLSRRIDKRTEREIAADAERPRLISPHADREEAAFLENAILHLPENQQEVVTLKIWGGLTFAEISETLEIPAGTAASRYRLALDALRQNLSSSLI